MTILLVILGIAMLLGLSSENTRVKLMSGAMAGTAMGCFYLIFVMIVVIGSVPLIIFLLGNPQALLPLFVGLIVFIVLLRILGQ